MIKPASPSAMTGTGKADPRGRRVCVWWALALGLLALLGIVCWTVGVPMLRVRVAVGRCAAEVESVSGGQCSLASKVAPAEVESLGDAGQAARRLSTYLALPGWMTGHRPAAAVMLVHCGEQAIPELEKLLEDGDVQVSVIAARGLKIMAAEYPRAAQSLPMVLENPRAEVRQEALKPYNRTMSRYEAEAMAIGLGKLLENSDLAVRRGAAFELSRVGAKAEPAAAALKAALNDPDQQVRESAARALKGLRAGARVFRVLTLNVQKGTPARKIARDVAAAGADIVCLQELDQGTKRSGGEDQIALLREALGVRGAYAPSYRDDGGTTGMAILSRFPVEDAVPVKLAGSRDIGLGATVKLPGATVTVFSVHLSATYKFDLGHLAETREMRRRETARLVELIGQTKGPVILAGDLNCALDPDLVAEFAKHLTDATAGVQATYPAKAPVAKIDYVFARGLEAVGSQAMPEGSSDHRAVRCELRLQD